MNNKTLYAIERKHRKQQLKTAEIKYQGIYSGNIYTLNEIWETHFITPKSNKFNQLFKRI